MPRVTKSKLNLRAQAALARSSRNLSTSRNTTRPSTPSHSSGPSTHTTPAVSPSPLNTPDVVSDEENDEIQENHENVYQYLPDIHIFNENPNLESPEEEEGYHTDDDLSELEDDELEESLKQQREGENESSRDMDQDTRNVFHTLMRDVSEKQWKKAESKRSLGYGSQTSERTEHFKRQKGREREIKEAESRKSSVIQ
jgi:hypothetical protein